MRASVEDWVRLGAERALTGPIARGDEATIERQRAAIGERAPELLPVYDALVDATRALRGGRAMKRLRTVAEVRAHVAAARGAGRSVGLVPTMGAFHAGHEALMRAARAECDEVIVSLFVNPAQFEEPADLAAYPRSEARDAAAAAALGVDALFAPAVETIYPDGFATTVRVGGLADVLEGAERGASHFDGVCTVVCKLFNIVAPDVAFFGQKDAQQVVVIRRMVRDLDIPVRLTSCPLCVSPTAWRSPPATPASARPSASVPSRSRAGWRRCATRSRPGSATPRRSRPRDAPRWPPRESSRSISPSSIPTRWSVWRRSPDGYSSSLRPASGRHG